MAAHTPRNGDASSRADKSRNGKLRPPPDLTLGSGTSWLRLWVDILDSPKVHELDVDLFAGWIKILIATKKHRANGKLPGGKTLAFWAHQDGSTVARWMRDLEDRGFLERDDDGQLWVHDWAHWQSPTNAERQQHYRDRKKSRLSQTLSGNADTDTDTDTDADTDTNCNARCNAPVTRVVTRYNAPVTRASAPPEIPPPVFDSRQQEVIDLAARRWGASNGDCIVGDLLRTYPADLVMEAIDRHWAKQGPAIKPALLMGTCRGMFADGWKPEQSKSQDAQTPSGAGVPPKTYGIIPGP